MNYKILVAEDDEDIVELLTLYLSNEGYEILSANNGEDALRIAKETKVDLAVLDIMMPKMNGYELTKKLREVSNLPILILSAKNQDSDKILGLGLGADDYLTKPFNPLEIIARVKAALRRFYDLGADAATSSDRLCVGDLVLDTSTCTLWKNDTEISLTPTEYKILALLMKSPGRIFTKVQIYESINGEYFENDDNTMMVHISKLRDKLEEDPRSPRYIKTVRGLGYKIESKD
ncbi:response regulator transcription factor [Pygmaiobacter massiliensis]|uniref:response regulator transcription factor n=1 Tax=Pygmaiobacter massiliensis TaxID=1917873 RepID=UPI000C7C2065|nr:response regulator transcription factor [Pygmaiobacter massiliensis]